jgi:hypothetical protein
VISGFRRDVGLHEICPLQGYYSALSGSSVLMFRDNISVPSSRFNTSKKEGLLGPWRWDRQVVRKRRYRPQRCVISEKSVDINMYQIYILLACIGVDLNANFPRSMSSDFNCATLHAGFAFRCMYRGLIFAHRLSVVWDLVKKIRKSYTTYAVRPLVARCTARPDGVRYQTFVGYFQVRTLCRYKSYCA